MLRSDKVPFRWVRLPLSLLLVLMTLAELPPVARGQMPIAPPPTSSKLNARRQEAERLVARSRATHRSPETVKLLQQAQKIYQQLGDRPREAYVLIELSATYYALSQDDLAIAAAQQAVTLVQPISDARESLRALSFLVELHRVLKQWQPAIAAQQQAVIVAQRANPREVGIQLRDLGRLYAQAEQYQNAIVAYQKSHKIGESLTFEEQNFGGNLKIDALKGMVDVYIKLQQPERVNESQQRLMQEIQAFALWQYTDAVRVGRDAPSDEPLLQTMVSLYQQLGDTRSYTEALLRLGQNQSSFKPPAQAMETLKAALALASQHNYSKLEDRALVSLGGLHKQQRQYAEAIAIYQRQATQAQARQDDTAYRYAMDELMFLYGESGQVEQAEVWRKRRASLPAPLTPPLVPSIPYSSSLPLLYRSTNGAITPAPELIPPPTLQLPPPRNFILMPPPKPIPRQW